MMTLFSASNHAGKSLNLGAVAVLHAGKAAEPELVTYEASTVTREEVDLRNVKFLSQMVLERKGATPMRWEGMEPTLPY